LVRRHVPVRAGQANPEIVLDDLVDRMRSVSNGVRPESLNRQIVMLPPEAVTRHAEALGGHPDVARPAGERTRSDQPALGRRHGLQERPGHTPDTVETEPVVFG
jgi:hypothetical protein